MYPKYYFTVSKFMFMKQINAHEFEYIKIIPEHQFCLEKGMIKSYFADNVQMFLNYQYKMKITEKTWQRLEEIYESQQHIEESH